MISFMFWGLKVPIMILLNGAAIALVLFMFKELLYND